MKLMLFALGASVALSAYAADPDEGNDPPIHPPWLAAAATSAPTTGQMDSMMKSMQEMHEKMMASKTPEDRARLMQEHSRLMQDCMGMMGRMHGGRGGGGMSMSPEMMGRRMDMMEMMMQMMMDREGIKPPATK